MKTLMLALCAFLVPVSAIAEAKQPQPAAKKSPFYKMYPNQLEKLAAEKYFGEWNKILSS